MIQKPALYFFMFLRLKDATAHRLAGVMVKGWCVSVRVCVYVCVSVKINILGQSQQTR